MLLQTEWSCKWLTFLFYSERNEAIIHIDDTANIQYLSYVLVVNVDAIYCATLSIGRVKTQTNSFTSFKGNFCWATLYVERRMISMQGSKEGRPLEQLSSKFGEGSTKCQDKGPNCPWKWWLISIPDVQKIIEKPNMALKIWGPYIFKYQGPKWPLKFLVYFDPSFNVKL